MGDVISGRFNAKPSSSEQELRRRACALIVDTLTRRGGFHRDIATKAADLIVDSVMEQIRRVESLAAWEWQLNVRALPLSAVPALNAAGEQWRAQTQSRVSALLNQAMESLISVAGLACLVMCHSDQL